MAEHLIPIEKYHTLRASLVYNDPGPAALWYKHVLDAEEYMRMQNSDDKVLRSEIHIGDSALVLKAENGENNRPDQTYKHPVFLHVYVNDVDETMKKAVNNGARKIMVSTDRINRERVGIIKDPFGYTWTLASAISEHPTKLWA